jgi:hypothetical protein
MNIGELAKFRAGIEIPASGTAVTTYLKAADTQGLALVNSSGTSVVTVTDAGAVTVGATGGIQEHVINGVYKVSYDGDSFIRSYASSSVAYINSLGVDNSTNGSFSFNSLRKDSSNSINVGTVSGTGAWTLGPSGAADSLVHSFRGRLRPATDNTYNFGDSSFRCVSIYAVNGTINTSDERLKKNIAEIEPTLDKVLKLKPSKWEPKFDDYVLGKSGFIAQELASVFPELVHESTEPVKGIDNVLSVAVNGPEMAAILVKAVQELSAKLDEANARIAALEAK